MPCGLLLVKCCLPIPELQAAEELVSSGGISSAVHLANSTQNKKRDLKFEN